MRFVIASCLFLVGFLFGFFTPYPMGERSSRSESGSPTRGHPEASASRSGAMQAGGLSDDVTAERTQPWALHDQPDGDRGMILEQFKTLIPVSESSARVWMPAGLLSQFDFDIGDVGERFAMSEQSSRVYETSRLEKQRIESVISKFIAHLRSCESQASKITVISDEHLVVVVPPALIEEALWGELAGEVAGIVGSFLAQDVMRRLRPRVEREYPPGGRTVEVKLTGEDGISVLTLRGNGASWENSFPKSISHLVSIAIAEAKAMN